MIRNIQLGKRMYLFLCVFIFTVGQAGLAADDTLNEEKTINYIINTGESAAADQILYRALQRICYKMTMDAMPLAYATQTANSGERDALANQSINGILDFSSFALLIKMDRKMPGKEKWK